MPDRIDTDTADMVDPEIRRFVDDLNAGYARHAAEASQSLDARRRVAEIVRKDLRSGGPDMAETRQLDMNGIKLRLLRPTDTPNLPVMLYIHGGGWTVFSMDTHDRLMREYAARAGIAVIGIDYSLSPEHKFPVALEEIMAALDWIEEKAAELDVDAGRMFVGGDSAGANLSVAVSLLRRERGKPPLAGMVLNYGAFSPVPTDTYERFDGPQYALEIDEMNEFWANYVSGPEDLANPLIDVLRPDLHGLPPAFLAIAECDILTGCNHAFAQKLEAAGVPVKAETYRGATHSFMEAMGTASLASQALDDQAAWIAQRAGLADN